MKVDYRQCLATLKEVSFDDDNNISLIEDEQKEHRVYNFDGVSKKLCKKLRGEKNFSCDAYYVKREDDTYLIEFKNQPEGNIDQKKLKNKIYDSIPQPLAAIKQKRIILFVVACAIMHLITVSTYHSIGN